MLKKIFTTTAFCMLMFQALWAQSYKGNLKDEKGDAIIGATIMEVGNAANGTVSDLNGNFLITAAQNASLKISSLGFETIEMPGTATFMNVILKRSAKNLNSVQVIGSRNYNRTSVNSLAPVDIINVKEVTAKNGQLDLNQLLQYAAPSFNSNRQSGSDGADHIDPATLRGLGPDQTLVLINGKRQHQSSLVNLYGSRGRGNNGTDLNTIPASSIERIEILRDGAAAQYGSDAIAGVINIVLKSGTKNVEINAGGGMNQASYRTDTKKFDGQTYNLSANYGWVIKKTGYLNVTLDRNAHDHTNRAGVVPDSMLARRQFGDAKIGNTSLYANFKMPVNEKMFVYAFAGLNYRMGEAYAWTRMANDARNNVTIYPNGFDPIIASTILDHSVCVGLKSDLGKGWNMDISNINGANSFIYSVKNTLNASMGNSSPTSFNAGGFGLSQNTSNIDFSKNYTNWLKGVNVSAGAEYRMENYNIKDGDENSYKAYDKTMAPGSQGFPGFQPSDAIKASRNSMAAYADLEADIIKPWTVALATRFENYSDFGKTLNWKAATRYQITKWLAFRGTASTGFRAPSLPQINFNQTITNFVAGVPQEVLVARNGGTLANALGIPKLKQETSENYCIGLTAKASNKLSFTVDAYQINVKDRIVLTGNFSASDSTDLNVMSLLQSNNVGAAQLFTNAVSTTTRGLDIIAVYTTYFEKDRFNVTLAANFNELKINSVYTNTTLNKFKDKYFDLREQYFLKASAPPYKVSATFDYTVSKLTAMARLTYFGKVALADWNYDEKLLNIYVPTSTTDFSLTYKFNNKYAVTAGSSNLFNIYPTKFDPLLTESGGAWDPVQMGNNGRFYYLKVKANIFCKK